MFLFISTTIFKYVIIKMKTRKRFGGVKSLELPESYEVGQPYFISVPPGVYKAIYSKTIYTLNPKLFSHIFIQPVVEEGFLPLPRTRPNQAPLIEITNYESHDEDVKRSPIMFLKPGIEFPLTELPKRVKPKRRRTSPVEAAGPAQEAGPRPENVIDFENIPAELVRLSPREKIVGRRVSIPMSTPFGQFTYHLTLKNTKHATLIFENETRDHCIEIEINPLYIELVYYYYNVPINECPRIPHDFFFYFLKQLGILYRKDIQLTDVSKKTTEGSDCVIESNVFAFAGYPTFYQRYQFVNENFGDFVRFVQSMSWLQFCQTAHISIARDQYPKLLKWFGAHQMDEHSNMEMISKQMVDECKSSKKDNKLMAWLAGLIASGGAAINSSRPYPNYYTRLWTLKYAR